MTEPSDEGNILRGAGQIAAFLYGSPKHRRKVYHLLKAKTGTPPTYRLGSIIYARKSELLRWIVEQETKGRGE